MAPKLKLLKTFCFSHAHNSQPVIESRKPYAGLGKTIVGNKLKEEQNPKSEALDIQAGTMLND